LENGWSSCGESAATVVGRSGGPAQMTIAAIVGVGAVGPARQAGEGAARRQTRPVPGPRVPPSWYGPPSRSRAPDPATFTCHGSWSNARFALISPVTKVRDMWGPAVGSPRTAPGAAADGGGGSAGAGVAWWPARPAHLPHPAGQPAGVGQRTAQEKLDLGVRAPQLVGGPPGQGVMDGGIEPQQDALALAHVVTVPALTGTGSRC